MWNEALMHAVEKTKGNIEKFGDLFPWTGIEGGDYKRSDHEDWTEGFWSGLLWLSYEASGDPVFREAAIRTVNSFRKRLVDFKVLDHHDIGFLYMPSAVAWWMLEEAEEAKRLGLEAAETLLKRWRPAGGYIQAWGPAGDPQNGGRIIIDCLLNIPLLYWAYEQTGDSRYRDTALAHVEKCRRFLVRGDDSSYHTFYFKQETGEPIGGGTHQGYTDGSTWTRGQAWGIYGFILSYRYTQNPLYLETSRRMAAYFIDRLPEDQVTYWDFDVPAEEGTPRDSSATAIACCGILELAGHLPEKDPDRIRFESAVHRCMKSLTENYFTSDDPEAEGLLRHGSYHVGGGMSPDDFVIWGDYFYMEALMRLVKNVPGYWYERKA
ncbi:glycoside hydrolase family 88 protein [Paenibacillus harenae]|uniref:Unsaturated chondroitin disaccharide hydrolase n=1 Tax=Paenibacillus harenae TaxID=306543 RepID=A0ABT9UAW5_PAEHA|nr:glycoside hydrolase family 88 protein [Paenibacillus harenae]MDQ0116781.1 unsaturated chondroitin disaccharide hydrolase [Paenibacillus harenae]